jgi:hypothetical protein
VVIGHDGLARQRLDDRAGQQLSHRQHLRAGAQGSGADQHGDLAALVEDAGRTSQTLGIGH